MKKTLLFGAVAAALAAGFFAGGLFSQQAKEASASDDMMAKMMEECIKYGTPGEQHAKLEPLIGKWTAECKFWMTPDSPVETNVSSCEANWILNGRYVEEKFTGDWQGQPFEGRSITGYDNLKNTYFSSWFDSMSTSSMQSTGKVSADGKTFSYVAKTPNPFAGWKEQEVKHSIQVVDNDKHIFTMYFPFTDGKLFKHMEITYTRR